MLLAVCTGDGNCVGIWTNACHMKQSYRLVLSGHVISKEQGESYCGACIGHVLNAIDSGADGGPASKLDGKKNQTILGDLIAWG